MLLFLFGYSLVGNSQHLLFLAALDVSVTLLELSDRKICAVLNIYLNKLRCHFRSFMQFWILSADSHCRTRDYSGLIPIRTQGWVEPKGVQNATSR